MLEIISWIVGIVIVLVILYFVINIFFTIRSIRQVIGWAKEEMNQLPADYQNMRKEVVNQNEKAKPAFQFVRGIFIRWYKRI